MLVNIFAPVLMNTKYKAKIKSLLQKYDYDSVILNLGSGPQFIGDRKDIINLDAFAFNEVDIVADVHDLPIMDNTVDLVLNISLLEHVPQPEKVVEEMYRILKPGGEIIACLPFMMPFHAAPFDHYRWTQPGIKELFSLYQIYEIDIAYGPTSGMLWVLQEWMAIILSFGFKTLHDIAFLILMVVMSPIKLLDKLLNKYPFAEKIASGFYINAQK